MSLVGSYNVKTGTMDPLALDYKNIQKQMGIKNEISPYKPSKEEFDVLGMIKRHFTLGYVNMYTPRVEFNDLAVIQRAMVDQMNFNTYQPNNGEGYWGDDANSWRSNAIRPIIRNKSISIAAHATARLLFPKVFAWNNQNDDQKDAAQVMSDLMEWSGEQSNYTMTSLYNTLSALVNPVACTYTEYSEVYRYVKRGKKEDGSWNVVKEPDPILSGFKDIQVSPDEIFIPNFFESDIQKQDWVIWRRVISYEMAEQLHGSHPNFAHVKPGIQTIYNDANQTFYQVYDSNMRPYMVEWVQYYNRSLDLKIDVDNGIMVSDYDCPNPRQDKLYPFTWTGYEIINNRCAYFKSLAFKLMHDANIINTLYPMIIDGTYLNMFSPGIIAGEENIGSNIIVPGRVTALSNPQATYTPIQLGTNLKAGFDALSQVEESINQSSENPVTSNKAGDQTAYEIQVRENERNTEIGLFMTMIGNFVKQYGRLRLGDILQYMTIGEVQDIEGDNELVYKTFLLHDKKTVTGMKTRKIKFDSSLPNELPKKDYKKHVEKMSFDALEESGGLNSETELYKVNPELFRDLTYMLVVSPDVMNPLSENVERAYNLELYDRLIMNQRANQEEVLELLLDSTPTTRKDPKKYIQQQQPGQAGQSGNPMDMAKQAMGGLQPPQPTQLPNKAVTPAMAGQ